MDRFYYRIYLCLVVKSFIPIFIYSIVMYRCVTSYITTRLLIKFLTVFVIVVKKYIYIVPLGICVSNCTGHTTRGTRSKTYQVTNAVKYPVKIPTTALNPPYCSRSSTAFSLTYSSYNLCPYLNIVLHPYLN